MKKRLGPKARILSVGGLCVFLVVAVASLRPFSSAFGGPPGWYCQSFGGCGEEPPNCEVGGSWYWLRSPEQEKRVVIALYNRYCIRCHGVDGRGVWDIPDVPSFANPRWQSSRSDGDLARAILEGRGAVMPPWRGTLSLEEAWAIARYVRTFVPGTEMSRPDYGTPTPPGPSVPPAQPAQNPPGPAPSPRTSGLHSFAPQVSGPALQISTPSTSSPVW
jgi:Cytochrome C oxidase, cbb3-type, subunit III